LRLQDSVPPGVGEVLSTYGVEPSKHAALLSELKPLLSPGQEGEASSPELEVVVERGPKGLGIVTDQNNIVVQNTGQPNLQVGDRITAVEGVPVTRAKGVADVLKEVLVKGQTQYKFVIERGGKASLESVLAALARTEGDALGDAGLYAQDAGGCGELLSVAESLEEQGGVSNAEGVLGFWKLVFTSDPTFALSGGVTGYGSAPLKLAMHWQCFQDKDPRGQTVEMIANMDMGTHAIAAVKGDWSMSGDGVLAESYSRLEYGGSLQATSPMSRDTRCTYVGETVRMARGSGGLFVYVRITAQEAGKEIAGWLEKKVAGSVGKGPSEARWEQMSKESGAQSTLGN